MHVVQPCFLKTGVILSIEFIAECSEAFRGEEHTSDPFLVLCDGNMHPSLSLLFRYCLNCRSFSNRTQLDGIIHCNPLVCKQLYPTPLSL